VVPYQRKQGDNGFSIGGDRGSGTVYIVDGMPIRGGRNVNFPPSGIDRARIDEQRDEC
jgi:hypothetical protein